jgi:hypothetical protein
VLTTIDEGKTQLTKITQSNTVEKRKENAEQCVSVLKMTLPTLLDRADNRVNYDYAAWPDRLFVVGVDGKIAYRGGPGPGGFRVAEVEEWLRKNVP